jgi:defect-in-organelle-trafficking protein DotB
MYPHEPEIRWHSADINGLLLWGSAGGMTDLLLCSGNRAWMKLDGIWRAVTERSVTADELLAALERMTRNNSISAMIRSGQQDYDFIHQVEEGRGQRRRYRGNAAPVVDGYSTGVRIVFRVIPSEPKRLSDLKVEQAIWDHAFPKQGLVLVTGVMGSGKSTLLAAVLREIIERGGQNVITFEQPVEYDFSTVPNPGGPASQSMIPEHFRDFALAVRSSTRAAPNVVLLGESRDRETLRSLIESAETGVAAYSTVHTRSVPATITRILNVFPREEHLQIAATMISGLRLIVSQRLIPHPSGKGVTALREFLPFTALIRDTLLETPAERLIHKMEELLPEHGQTIQQAADKAYSEGNIPKEWHSAILAERREKGGRA